jgi:hypothetical protein
MSGQNPPKRETPEERLERISKWPSVIVHRNPNPTPFVPDPQIWIREGVTPKEILSWDDDDKTDL